MKGTSFASSALQIVAVYGSVIFPGTVYRFRQIAEKIVFLERKQRIRNFRLLLETQASEVAEHFLS